MEDEHIDPKTGKPRRHDSKDPWSLMAHDVALGVELGPFVPPLPTGEVGEPRVGDFVLVVMVRERNDPQGRYEALWVEVTGRDGGAFDGVFDNQPTWVRGVASGDAVRFEQRHVMRVRAG